MLSKGDVSAVGIDVGGVLYGVDTVHDVIEIAKHVGGIVHALDAGEHGERECAEARSIQSSMPPFAYPHTADATTPTLANLNATRWTRLRGVKPNSIAMRASFSLLIVARRGRIAAPPWPYDFAVPSPRAYSTISQRAVRSPHAPSRQALRDPIHRRECEAGYDGAGEGGKSGHRLEDEEERHNCGKVYVALITASTIFMP